MWPNPEDDRAMWEQEIYDRWAKRMKCSDCAYCETWRADGNPDGPIAAWCTYMMEEIPSPELSEPIYGRGCMPDCVPTAKFAREWEESDRLERVDRAYVDAREEALWARCS